MRTSYQSRFPRIFLTLLQWRGRREGSYWGTHLGPLPCHRFPHAARLTSGCAHASRRRPRCQPPGPDTACGNSNVCLGHHTGWKILIHSTVRARARGRGGSLSRECSPVGAGKVHTFQGKLFPPGKFSVTKRVDFSLGVGGFAFPGGLLPFSWERVISSNF